MPRNAAETSVRRTLIGCVPRGQVCHKKFGRLRLGLKNGLSAELLASIERKLAVPPLFGLRH